LLRSAGTNPLQRSVPEWLFLIAYYPTGGTGTCLDESHAAAVRQNVIRIEKTMGMIKRYLKLTTVMAAKQSANAHVVPRMSAKVDVGRPPSCHANIAVNR
jgi:hypothetical protein